MDLTKLQEPLNVSEIDFRIQSINKGGYATILAYKDARVDINRLNNEMGAIDENSEIYYGADAFEQVFSRIPIFWPIAIIMKIPCMIYISRFFYKIIAKNRHKLTQEGCDI